MGVARHRRSHGNRKPGLPARACFQVTGGATVATVPALGLLGWGAVHSRSQYLVDGMSGGTVQLEKMALSELKGELPKARVGKETMNRLVLGGNLIGGWAHARDLKYVSSLFKAHNTEKKIFETLQLAEAAGIDTINIGNPTNPVMTKSDLRDKRLFHFREDGRRPFSQKVQVVSLRGFKVRPCETKLSAVPYRMSADARDQLGIF